MQNYSAYINAYSRTSISPVCENDLTLLASTQNHHLNMMKMLEHIEALENGSSGYCEGGGLFLHHLSSSAIVIVFSYLKVLK